MYKKFYLKTMLLLCALIVGYGSAWADTYTYDFSSGGVNSSSSNTWTTDYFTITQEKGTYSTNVGNYLTAPRWYQNHLVTITPATNITITKIVINCSEAKYNGQDISASTGSVSASGNNSTWTGSITASSPVVLTMGKQCRPTSLEVTYSSSSSTSTCATPTFSPAAGAVLSGTEVSINCSTSGATIYYTTDGTTPTSSSSVYSSPIEITEVTTIKAYAVKDGYDDSDVATAEYTIREVVSGYNIDFESDIEAYVDWTFENVGNTNTDISAHGGDKYGANINANGSGVATLKIQTKEKVANPGTFTCFLSKTSNNTTQSTWYIQVSADGSEWTEVASKSATDMSKGSWTEFTADLSTYSNVYVRLYYEGSTAVRAVDDISLTMSAPLASIAISGDYPTTFVEGSTFSHEGIVVTASYEDNTTKDVTEDATFSEPDMTQVGEQTVIVSYQNMTATYTITITEAPSHTATFSVNGETYSASPFKEGVAIVFPSDAEAPEGYSIVGWLAEEMSEPQDEAPANIINSAVMGNADVTYYALLAVVTPGTATTTTDELDRATTDVTGTSYTDWSGKTVTSDAVYAGNSAGGNESIQLRSNNSNSGIVTTTSGGKVKKVIVTWNDATQDGRTLDVYGSNTAYTAASDLYDSTKQGTNLGSIVKGTSTELTVSGDYTFIGLRSNNGAMYLTSISIDWQTGTPDTYSNFCTTIPEPTISIAISDAGYATYVAADNVSFPEDVTAYIVSEVTASSIKLTEVLAVAKDVPVVVKGTAGTHDLEVVTADDCDDVTENKLLVSDGTVSDNILVLANKSNGVGFYTWAGGNLPAGKVYLVNPNSSREFFGFDEGVATSISTIDNGQWTMDNAYNLQGQKVGSEYKGIIIVNGKKFINK